ncbi:MAG: helix-turn-helix domain-containing protein [Clostridia bacterium]|nr:helix-turn-helix domain-containing protein [Clostridia bacterium]
MTSLGEKIASLRKARGITQEQLAEKCSVSPQAVSKWENDITSPDISLLPRLSELLGVSCDELLGVQRAEVVAVNKDTVDLTKMLLKVRIKSGDGDKVNINLPLSIAELLIKNKEFVATLKKSDDGEKRAMGALSEIDFEQILSLVNQGAIGKIVDIESADGDIVEIWVE